MISRLKCCNRSIATVETEESLDLEVTAIYEAISKSEESKNSLDVGEDLDKSTHQDSIKDLIKIDRYRSQLKGFDQLERFINKYENDPVQISDRLRKFRSRTDDSDDTMLHTAALLSGDVRVIKLLMENCPELISIPRTGSYQGQTALHITIAKGKEKATEAILENLKKENKANILSMKATGSKFKNNIMMGETVFSVAVLTLNTDMVDLLLQHDAGLDKVNSRGDSVIHTLVKYAAIKPDQTDDIIRMLKYLNKIILQMENENKLINRLTRNFHKTSETEKDVGDEQKRQRDEDIDCQDIVDKMWFKENNDLMTPLKLAASVGSIDIFNALMSLKDVFYFPSNSDGSFDTKYYDITEIDHVAQYRYSTNLKSHSKDTTCFSPTMAWYLGCVPRGSSVIESLSRLKWKEAKPLVDTLQIKMIIAKRWKSSRKFFYVLGVLHLIVMFLFTTSIFYRKRVMHSSDCKDTNNDCSRARMYSQVVPWLLFIYGLAVVVSEIYRLYLRHTCKVFKHHNNSWYRASLLMLALGLGVDAGLYTWHTEDSNDLIFVILILGFWFLFFFLKGFEKFSVYIVLFQKVIMGDLLRFGLIICVVFSAYSFAMYAVLVGRGNVEEFSTFENTTLTMFGYMLGLKDLSFLDSVELQTQRLVAVIYVMFIITTYILLINTLIAMMSRTSENIFDDRKLLNIIQTSSVILFLDGFYIQRQPIDDTREAGVKRFRENRFYLAIKTDQMGTMIRDKNLTPRRDDITIDLLKRSLRRPPKRSVIKPVRKLITKTSKRSTSAKYETAPEGNNDNATEVKNTLNSMNESDRQAMLDIYYQE
uniref:Uncharacterized protein n=1 Tax=Biomphalaria glabrata TaxID=6526 RepID=A0A2C9L145_BIOGL